MSQINMSRIKGLTLCLIFILLMRKPQPPVVSQPSVTVADTTSNVTKAHVMSKYPF
jgi:hypothetical protein